MSTKLGVRPLIGANIEELSALVDEAERESELLDILGELKRRSTPRARELCRVVERKLGEHADGSQSAVLTACRVNTSSSEVRSAHQSRHHAESSSRRSTYVEGLQQDPVVQIVIPGATWRDGSDLWKALCKACHDHKVKNSTELAYLLTQIEKAYKSLEGQQAMPEKYRSNKSILVGAFRLGVPIFDQFGKPLGKTAVERLCKSNTGE
jgi:hypothetical protein